MTTKAMGMALGGFASTALALVGTSTRRVVIGAIAVTVALSFVVPSATARTACVVPIMLGIITAFGVDRQSRFAASRWQWLAWI